MASDHDRANAVRPVDNPWRDPDEGFLAGLFPAVWPAVAAELVVAALLIGLIVADGRAP